MPDDQVIIDPTELAQAKQRFNSDFLGETPIKDVAFVLKAKLDSAEFNAARQRFFAYANTEAGQDVFGPLMHNSNNALQSLKIALDEVYAVVSKFPESLVWSRHGSEDDLRTISVELNNHANRTRAPLADIETALQQKTWSDDSAADQAALNQYKELQEIVTKAIPKLHNVLPVRLARF